MCIEKPFPGVEFPVTPAKDNHRTAISFRAARNFFISQLVELFGALSVNLNARRYDWPRPASSRLDPQISTVHPHRFLQELCFAGTFFRSKWTVFEFRRCE
jgi:hypothetical protein